MIYGGGDPQRRLARRMSDGRPAIILDEKIAARRWSRGYAENVAAAVWEQAEERHESRPDYSAEDRVLTSLARRG